MFKRENAELGLSILVKELTAATHAIKALVMNIPLWSPITQNVNKRKPLHIPYNC